MKRIQKILSIMLLSTLIISCSSDDDDSQSLDSQNFLRIGDQEFELKSGVIQNFGVLQDLHNFDIYLFSIETNIEDGEVIPDENSDTVSFIYFELFTDNSEDLDLGNYTFNDYDDRDNFSYTFSETGINIAVQGENEQANFVEIQNGTLEVLSNGATYEFEFSGTDENNRAISLYYRGSLNSVDFLD